MFVEKHVAQHLVNRFFTIITNHDNAMEDFYDKEFKALNEMDESFNDLKRKLLIVTSKELAVDAAYVLIDQENDYDAFIEEINQITDAQIYLD